MRRQRQRGSLAQQAPCPAQLANMMQSECEQSVSRSLALTGQPSTVTLPHPTVTWWLLESVGKSTGGPEDTFLPRRYLPCAQSLRPSWPDVSHRSAVSAGLPWLPPLVHSGADQRRGGAPCLPGSLHTATRLCLFPSLLGDHHPHVSVHVCTRTHTHSLHSVDLLRKRIEGHREEIWPLGVTADAMRPPQSPQSSAWSQ